MTTALQVTRGDDEVLDLAFKTAADAPLDISGATGIWFTAKHRASDRDSVAVLRKELGDGVTVVSPTGGTVTVAIDAGDLDAIDAPTNLVWDVQLKDAAGKIHTAGTGTLRVLADVTRSTTV